MHWIGMGIGPLCTHTHSVRRRVCTRYDLAGLLPPTAHFEPKPTHSWPRAIQNEIHAVISRCAENKKCIISLLDVSAKIWCSEITKNEMFFFLRNSAACVYTDFWEFCCLCRWAILKFKCLSEKLLHFVGCALVKFSSQTQKLYVHNKMPEFFFYP